MASHPREMGLGLSWQGIKFIHTYKSYIYTYIHTYIHAYIHTLIHNYMYLYFNSNFRVATLYS